MNKITVALIVSLVLTVSVLKAENTGNSDNVIIGKYITTENGKLKIEGEDGNIYMLDKEHVTGSLTVNGLDGKSKVSLKKGENSDELHAIAEGSMVVININGIVVVTVEENAAPAPVKEIANEVEYSNNNAITNTQEEELDEASNDTKLNKTNKIERNTKAFGKGISALSIGVGYNIDNTFPVNLNYEYGVWENSFSSIGVGGMFAYSSSIEQTSLEDYKYRYSNLMFGLRSSWHYTAINKLDLYGGISLGYTYMTGTIKGEDVEILENYGLDTKVSDGIFLYSIHAGAKYYFTNNIGVYGELGYGLSIINVGLSFKF